MQDRRNGELGNILGNLVARATAMSLLGQPEVPVHRELTKEDMEIVEHVERLVEAVDRRLTVELDIQNALNDIWDLLQKLNQCKPDSTLEN